MRDKQKYNDKDVVVVCPVDPYVNTDYFKALQALSNHMQKAKANIALMGIKPTYPSENYGYVIPEKNANFSKVRMFKEKAKSRNST